MPEKVATGSVEEAFVGSSKPLGGLCVEKMTDSSQVPLLLQGLSGQVQSPVRWERGRLPWAPSLNGAL